MPPTRRNLALLTMAALLVAGCTGGPADGPGDGAGGGGANDGSGEGPGTSPPSPGQDPGVDPGVDPGPGASPNPASPRSSNVTGDGFAWDLLRALRGEAPGANLFASPVSVVGALCLALEGAEGATRDAIAATLGLSEDAGEDCRALTGSLMRERNASGAEVAVGNSVWIRDAFEPAVKQAYLEALREDFHAQAFVRPFDQGTVDELNAWVANATRGMIPTIVDELPEELVLMLANAIFFDGRWAAAFDANLTSPGPFRLADGSTVEVPTMRNASAANVSLARGEGFRAARLPYADGHHAMVILLPDTGRTPDDVAGQLNDAGWARLLGDMERHPAVDLALPRFRMEWGGELKGPLSTMGMAVAFDRDAADFSGIADVAPERLYISFVKHKAALEVDEEGTRAAAATVVGVETTSAPPPPPAFHVDRPFLLAIVDDQVGMPLFLGLVEDPREA